MKISIFLYITYISIVYSLVYAQYDTTYYPNKNIKSIKKLISDSTSQQLFYYPNGKINSIENYKNGLLNGFLYSYDFDGNLIAKENWLNGVQYDSAWYYHPNGTLKRKGTYKEGLYDGLWLSFYDNGFKKNEGFYLMGNLVGKWYFYSQLGKLEQMLSYKNGIAEGESQEYHITKSYLVWEGNYCKGQKCGNWTQYNKNRRVKKKIVYQ